jgi:hypothetical protein
MLCNDICEYVTLFLDNIKDLIAWKSVCKYNYSHEHTANFMVSKFYDRVRTPMMKLSSPFYSDIQIQNSGLHLQVLYADRLMNDHHFKYIYNLVELHCRYAKLTDVALGYLPNLKKLYCDHCNTFTDVGLSKTHLELLDCGYWKSSFTDSGLLSIRSTLTQLYCRYNVNFTDVSLQQLTNLEVLHINSNTNYTDKPFTNLYNLSILYCGKNTNLSDYAFINLSNLVILSCDKNNKITNAAFQFTPKLRALFTYCNELINNEGFKYIPELVILNCKNSKCITNECLSYLGKLQDLTCSFTLPDFDMLQMNNPCLTYINTDLSRSIDII